jgi:hypothetical protein
MLPNQKPIYLRERKPEPNWKPKTDIFTEMKTGTEPILLSNQNGKYNSLGPTYKLHNNNIKGQESNNLRPNCEAAEFGIAIFRLILTRFELNIENRHFCWHNNRNGTDFFIEPEWKILG